MQGEKAKELVTEIYEFPKTIKLFDKEVFLSGEGEKGIGKEMPFHWRRGHYRMQRYGAGLIIKKRIRIKPCQIRKDKLIGDVTKTTVEYIN